MFELTKCRRRNYLYRSWNFEEGVWPYYYVVMACDVRPRTCESFDFDSESWEEEEGALTGLRECPQCSSNETTTADGRGVHGTAMMYF
jgi:hypothetical protein